MAITTKKPATAPTIEPPNPLVEYIFKHPIKTIFCVLLLIPACGPALIELYARFLIFAQSNNLAGRTNPLYLTDCYVSQLTSQEARQAGLKACAVTNTTQIMAAPDLVLWLGGGALLMIAFFYFALNTDYLGNRNRKKAAALVAAQQVQAKTQQEAKAKAEQETRALAEQKRQADIELAVHNPANAVLGTSYRNRFDPRRFAFKRIENQFIDTFLTPAHLTRHMLITAPTRSGKTYNLVLPLISLCHRNKFAGVFFDPKGDDFSPIMFHLNFSMVAEEAEFSIRLSLIDDGLVPLDAAKRLAEAIIPTSRESYFSDSSRNALIAFLIGHYYVYQKQWPELADILMYTRQQERREELLAALQRQLNDPAVSGGQRREVEDAITYVEIAGERVQNGNDALGNLKNELLKIATGRYRDYITTNPKKGISVRQMINQRLVVRIAFTREQGEIGEMLGRLIISQYTDTVLSPGCDVSYLKLLVVDEAHNYVTPALGKAFAQAAGRNCGYILATQNLEQFTDENLRAEIFANAKNKVILQGVSAYTAQSFAEAFGKPMRKKISSNSGQSSGQSRGTTNTTSTSTNIGKNTGTGKSQTPESGFFAGGNSNSSTSKSKGISNSESQAESDTSTTGTSAGETVTIEERYNWTPTELATIPTFHGVMQLEDGKSSKANEAVLVKFLGRNEREKSDGNLGDKRLKIKSELLASTPIQSLAAPTTPPAAPKKRTKPAAPPASLPTQEPAAQEPTTPPAAPKSEKPKRVKFTVINQADADLAEIEKTLAETDALLNQPVNKPAQVNPNEVEDDGEL